MLNIIQNTQLSLNERWDLYVLAVTREYFVKCKVEQFIPTGHSGVLPRGRYSFVHFGDDLGEVSKESILQNGNSSWVNGVIISKGS